jgi:hypothetical protein
LTYGLGEETGWRGFAFAAFAALSHGSQCPADPGRVLGCWHPPAFFFRDTYVELGALGFHFSPFNCCS